MTQEMTERNDEIMRMVAQGKTRRTIAEHFGMGMSTVSEIVTRERAKHPVDKPSEIEAQVAILDDLVEQAAAVARLRAAPVTAGKDGFIVMDPEDHTVVRDHSGRLTAMSTVKALLERKAKLLGLDSATKTEMLGSVTYTIEGVNPDDI